MRFFSDYYESLAEGIINKRICGIGITSFVLENNTPTIICVPTIEMIKNKISQYPNNRRKEHVFGLFGKVNTKEVEDYIESVEIPKILVTYDSLYKLDQILQNNLELHLIIDEFSELLDCYSFRNKAINSVFDITEKYRNTHKISFISATPIKKDYLPTALQNYPVTEIQWDESMLNKVKVEGIETTKPLNAALNIINKYRNNLVEGSNQAFFFVNSVTLIKTILDKSELLPSQVHVICSNTDKNQQTLDYFDISTTSELNNKPKKFNFITSTAFKGCDFYSETGISYVVSNNKNVNTLLTIDTDIYQIAGRIRTITNPFRNYIVHIYNKSPLKLTKEESFDLIEKQKERSLSIINLFNKGSDKEKDDLLYMYNASEIKGVYLCLEKGRLLYDELKELLERRVYETVIQVYQDGLSVMKAYEEIDLMELHVSELGMKNLATRNFISIFREYYQIPKRFNKEELNKTYPLIIEAEQKLGLDKCYALGFQKSKILKELTLINNKESIGRLLEARIPINSFIPIPDVKVILTRVYSDLGINKVAKANDLEGYLTIKDTKMIKEGKRIRGYIRVK